MQVQHLPLVLRQGAQGIQQFPPGAALRGSPFRVGGVPQQHHPPPPDLAVQAGRLVDSSADEPGLDPFRLPVVPAVGVELEKDGLEAVLGVLHLAAAQQEQPGDQVAVPLYIGGEPAVVHRHTFFLVWFEVPHP